MSNIGARIRSERQRLGLTQELLAAAGGIARSAQANYEAGRHAPNASYLAAIANAGIDVAFIITGTRAGTVDATLLGYCDAALRNTFAAKWGEEAQARVPSRVLAQVYNDALAALAPTVDRDAAARLAVARAIAWLAALLDLTPQPAA